MDWDWVPLTFFVVLPTMLREKLTLEREVTVGKVKEIIEFLNPVSCAGSAPIPLRHRWFQTAD
jgi:hypothetical protein